MRRREFIASAGGTLAAFIAACGGGDDEEELGPEWSPAGPVEGLKTNAYTKRRVALYPELDDKLTSIIYLRLESSPPGQRVIALNGRCTHLGCPTRYVAVSERFICPCHGGVFDFDGRALAPIAPKRLRRYRTAVRDGLVYVGPSLDPPIKIPYS